MTTPVIDIRDISVGFTAKSGATLPVLRNIDLTVAEGESVGIVGESGSGKSTLALASMGFLKRGLRLLDGSVAFSGKDMFSLTRTELEKIRGGELALIPQNSGQSLTPTLRIGAQLIEALRLHSSVSASEHSAKAVELLGQVRLPDPKAILSRFPSGSVRGRHVGGCILRWCSWAVPVPGLGSTPAGLFCRRTDGESPAPLRQWRTSAG